MKVVFRTNIDAYKSKCFPENLTFPPRKGETVLVNEVYITSFRSRKLPTRLEVVDVTWGEDVVICELHYKAIDIESAKLNDINLF